MFDIGFLELVVVAVISLLVLGPERLPGAARSAGLWIGRIRRMTSQFTREIDRQIKAEEFREKLRKEGDTLGVEHIQGTVRKALDQARDYESSVMKDDSSTAGTAQQNEPVPPGQADNSVEQAEPNTEAANPSPSKTTRS